MFGRKKKWSFNVVDAETFTQTLGWVTGEGEGPDWYSGAAKQDADKKMRADPRWAGRKVSLGTAIRDL